jgi:hypothetical protein
MCGRGGGRSMQDKGTQAGRGGRGGGAEACRIREHRQAGVAYREGGTDACRIREHRQAGVARGKQRHAG